MIHTLLHAESTVTGLANEVLVGVPLQLFSGDFLYLAIAFFVLAILAAVVGARGVAGISMEVARIFILLFIVLAIISLLL